MTLFPLPSDDEPPRELPQDLQSAVKKTLAATHTLAPPSRYDAVYWREEREAIACVAVWQAARTYRPEVGVSREAIACVAVWQAARTYRPEVGVLREAFAVMCAKRAIFREWRRVREWEQYETEIPIDEETGEEMEIPDESALEQMELSVVYGEVRQALERLSEAERRLIDWHYGEEALSVREIAKRLGVSKSVAHPRLQQAVARLRIECGVEQESEKDGKRGKSPDKRDE